MINVHNAHCRTTSHTITVLSGKLARFYSCHLSEGNHISVQVVKCTKCAGMIINVLRKVNQCLTHIMVAKQLAQTWNKEMMSLSPYVSHASNEMY